MADASAIGEPAVFDITVNRSAPGWAIVDPAGMRLIVRSRPSERSILFFSCAASILFFPAAFVFSGMLHLIHIMHYGKDRMGP